jgi:DNA-binding CsgD family transcriptional regulator
VVGRVSSPQFVGRRAELAALEAALGQARGGVGSVVLLAGEAGVGKSRLIAELADRGSDGMFVVVGECLPLGDGELPYAPLVAAVRSLMRQAGSAVLDAIPASPHELAALMPELALPAGEVVDPITAGGSQARLFEQLLVLLTTAARAAPVVLVIEDFQWADRSTRDFLSFLVRAARREPVALIVSYRSDELHRRHPLRPFVLELERSGRAARIDLSSFTRDELSEQVTGIMQTAPPPALISELIQRSDGNPFFTEELLASSREPGTALPESLRDALLSRVEVHSGSVRAVLSLMSAAGRTVDHALLAAASELPGDELDRALRDAVEDCLLTQASPEPDYSFRHALMREAIYSDLLPGERRGLHLRLAKSLAERSRARGTEAAAPAELAYHWHAAGDLAAALDASLRAASAAQELYAFGEALVHYERALELWEAVNPSEAEPALSRLEVTRRAAEAAVRTGEPDRAVGLARQVVAQIDERREPVEAALAHERLGRYVWTAGRDEDALPEYRRAVELMPEEPPSEERALVLAAEGQALMLCSRVNESAVRCDEALAIARAVGAEAVEAHVLNTICGNLSSIGGHALAVTVAAQALEISQRLGLAEEMNRSYTNGGDALDKAGRVEESISLGHQGIDSAHRFGVDRSWGDFLRAEIAGRLLQTGRWKEGEAPLDEVTDRGPSGMNAGNALTHLGRLLAERGEFKDAARALDRADDMVPRSGASMWLGPLAATRASLELWAGRPEAAGRLVAACLERVAGRELVFYTARVYDRGARACGALAAQAPWDKKTHRQQSAVAEQLLERLDRLVSDMVPEVPPLVCASRALCAAEGSRVGHAGDPALWAEAAQRWEEAQNVYEAAYARWGEAEALLAGGGERARAGALVRQAHAVARELGARPLQGELEQLARRARIDLGESGSPEPAPNAGLEQLELTPRELEVLALLTDGLTNREIGAELFISEKTASVHVSRILSKLSLPNRAAAAAAAQRLGIKRIQTPLTN